MMAKKNGLPLKKILVLPPKKIEKKLFPPPWVSEKIWAPLQTTQKYYVSPSMLKMMAPLNHSSL